MDSEIDGNNAESNKKIRNPFKIQQSKEEKERRQKKRARLIVRNISYKATEDTLRTHFAQWGELEDVNLLKRPDGKLVGCAFVQYATINQATKAILKSNNQPFLERPIYVDWAVGKNEYLAKHPTIKTVEKEGDSKKEESKEITEDFGEGDSIGDEEDAGGEYCEDENEEEVAEAEDDDDDNDGSKDINDEEDDEKKSKLEIKKLKVEKVKSNDVQEGCTIFLKKVPFDATESDLSKVFRKYGPLAYAIINRDNISRHSKGTAFVKFKTKESADLCLADGTGIMLMDEIIEVHPALSRAEISQQEQQTKNHKEGKDSRNLYLAREGLIMAGSKAALGVSPADMNRRHKLEQMKTQVLKDLNRFVSRNRLSIHNLPQNYDNEKLKNMIMKYTGYKPHECRVMRENKITAENPQGKCKGFGFVSFTTHQEALTALRKLNNNPMVFNTQRRPIVAFSIEDRSVHKLKDARKAKSKSNNPTYQLKQEKVKEFKQKLREEKKKKGFLLKDDKVKVKQEIKRLEKLRSKKTAKVKTKSNEIVNEKYVGMAAKPGTSIKMRSAKKIGAQSQAHMERVKTEKREQKRAKIRQIHLRERREVDRTKQGRKREVDDISHLVNKYKQMIDSKANISSGTDAPKAKKPKRTKWYKE